MHMHLREPISVVMPAFNAEQYIKKSVTSVLANLNPLDELLILDDGSLISVESVIQERNDPKIRIIRNTKNLGVSKSLNTLLEQAKHNLVARMDADDIMIRNRLDFQEQIFARDPSLDVNFMSVLNFGPNFKSFIPSGLRNLSQEEFRYSLLLGNPVAHSTAMYRKEKILGHGGYKNTVAEDYELWMRLAVDKIKVTKIWMPGVFYRKHPQQITRSKKWKESLVSDSELADTHLKLAKSLGWQSEGVWQQIVIDDKKNSSDQTLARFIKFASGRKNSNHGIFQHFRHFH